MLDLTSSTIAETPTILTTIIDTNIVTNSIKTTILVDSSITTTSEQSKTTSSIQTTYVNRTSTIVNTTPILALLSNNESFLTIFTNYTKQTTLTKWDGNTTAYQSLQCIVTVGSGINTQYHAINMMYAKDTVYDYNWNYLSNSGTGGLGVVTSVIYIDGFFFVCRSMDVWRFSTTWTNGITGTSIPSNPNYFSIAYDLTLNNFYVTSMAYSRIDIYDIYLAYQSSIYVSAGVGKGLAFYNGNMYVPNQNSQINILRNGTITNTVNISECSGTLGQITFDSNGYYAIACNSNSKVVLYSSANTFDSSLTTDSQPLMSFVDNQGRYIIATYGAIDIFF